MRSFFTFLLVAIVSCSWSIFPVYGQENETLYPMQKKTKWGFINAQGEWEIEPQYPQVLPFSEGLAAARTSGKNKWGFLNTSGEWAISPTYGKPGAYQTYGGKEFYDAPVTPFHGTYAAAVTDSAAILINKKGETVKNFPEYGLLRPFYDGLAAFGKKNEHGFMKEKGFINEKWEVVVEPNYEEIGNFHEGLAYAEKRSGNSYGYIDKKGEWAIEPQFDEVGPFNDGLAPVKTGAFEPYGYIKENGEWKIEPNFETATPFSEGLAFVTTEEEKAKKYIDRNGKSKIASPIDGFKICNGHPFENGLALVNLVKKKEECGRTMQLLGKQKTVPNAALGYIDKSGDIVYRQSLENGRYLKHVSDSIQAAERRAEKRMEKARARREKNELAECADYKAFGDTTAGSYVEIGYRGVTRRYYYNNDVFEKRGPEKYRYYIPPFQRENGNTFLQIRPITLEPSFMNEDELEPEDLSYGFSLGRGFSRSNPCIEFPSDATEDGTVSNVTKKPQSSLWKQGQIKYTDSGNSKNYILINAHPDQQRTPPESLGGFTLHDEKKVSLSNEDKLTFKYNSKKNTLQIQGRYSTEGDDGGTLTTGFRTSIQNFDGTTGKYVNEPIKKRNGQYLAVEYYHVLTYSDETVHIKHYKRDFTKKGVEVPDGKLNKETLPFTEEQLIGEYKGAGVIQLKPVAYTLTNN